MIKEISTFILDQVNPSVGYWERDVNCFVGYIPVENIKRQKVDSIARICAFLFNTPGAVVGDLPDSEDREVQIWNRHRSYFLAHEDAYVFYDALHGSSQWDLPVIVSGKNYNAMTIDAVASPAVIENPGPHGFVFSTNYIFRVCNP